MLETELYPPVKAYLEKHGYQVRAEVKNCDVVATKGDELIVVELKTSANMTLLVQATDRQNISDSVYVAIPKPKLKSKQWRGIKRVIKRLELGLLLVNQTQLGSRVVKQFDPMPSQRRKSVRKRSAIIQEVADRSGDYNVGGSTRQKIVTAYKENAILIACCLKSLGPSSPKNLRQLGTGDKTLAILSNNHYGWFQRVTRGIYQLTEQGSVEAMSHGELYERAESILQDAQASLGA